MTKKFVPKSIFKLDAFDGHKETIEIAMKSESESSEKHAQEPSNCT